MSEDSFKLQLSVKIGQSLLNLRAVTEEEFQGQLKWAVDNAEAIRLACDAFEPQKAVGSVQQIIHPLLLPTPRQAPAGQQNAGERLVTIMGVELQKEGRDGTPFKGTMYKIKLSDGTNPSTFKDEIGQTAIALQGREAYVVTEPAKNPRYQNLTSVRKA